MWVKLDDALAYHPKFIAAGPGAIELFVAGLCYCARYLTDGRIPRSALGSLSPGITEKKAREIARRLCSNVIRPGGAPSWIDEGDYFDVHDYLEYQPSREKVETDRGSARDRMKRVRGSSVPVRANEDRTSAEFRKELAERSPTPSRPVPSSEISTATSAGAGEDFGLFERTKSEHFDLIAGALDCEDLTPVEATELQQATEGASTLSELATVRQRLFQRVTGARQ